MDDVSGSDTSAEQGTGGSLPLDHVTRRRLLQAAGVTAGVVAAAPLIKGGTAQAAVGTPTGGPGGPPQPQLVDGGDLLTTNLGVRVSDDQNTLKAGTRGPSLLEDFHFREKLMHFDHERIPERVVHARGAGAHGVFTLHTSLAQYTSAAVLTEVGAQTETFVRFSTVNGSRGSADTARDARGFATKFYTKDGVWDLVGNNIPVFFIQDAIKFPDLVHSFKPEPDVEIPQASTAHDTFYDFISLTPESMHMIMWVTSDRGIPRSYRMMEGFGIHTFRLINKSGKSTYVKFHWKPQLGVHSLVWNEAQKLAGFDPDFHRRDLAEAINWGQYPTYDLGVQLLDEADVAKVKFDILDPTKIWPEEVVPVQLVGTMVLNRNPYNYFAETEQVAFCTSHVVPGIDFTDDPLLQGRNFSYFDTQLNRFNGPNWTQLPINQPRTNVNNFQQDGFMRYENRPGKVNYEPNSIGGHVSESSAAEGGFVSYAEPVSGSKLRARSATFGDHFSQATLFFQSQSAVQQQHIIQALQFELGKVTRVAVKQRMLTLLANIDTRLVTEVAASLGLPVPPGIPNTSIGTSPALQPERTPHLARTRQVAILVADGVDAADVATLRAALANGGLHSDVLAPHEGTVTGAGGKGSVAVAASIMTTDSVMYDAVFVPGGKAAASALMGNADVLHFVQEAFKHYKTIGGSADGTSVLTRALGGLARQPGVLTGTSSGAVAAAFVKGIAQDRHWDRQGAASLPA